MVTSTVDNLWLVIAMRYGIPGFLLFAGAYLSVIIRLVRAKNLSEVENNQRYALAFIAVSIVIAVSTVWLWNATYVYQMVILGSGAWLSEVQPRSASTGSVDMPGDSAVVEAQESRILRTRGKPHERKSSPSSTAPAGKSREVRRYSRVEPRRAQNKTDQSDPDKGH